MSLYKTKSAVIQAIKAMGLRVTWSAQWQEFCIQYPADKPGEGYFTADHDDAVATAMAMRDALSQRRPKIK